MKNIGIVMALVILSIGLSFTSLPISYSQSPTSQITELPSISFWDMPGIEFFIGFTIISFTIVIITKVIAYKRKNTKPKKRKIPDPKDSKLK